MTSHLLRRAVVKLSATLRAGKSAPRRTAVDRRHTTTAKTTETVEESLEIGAENKRHVTKVHTIMYVYMTTCKQGNRRQQTSPADFILHAAGQQTLVLHRMASPLTPPVRNLLPLYMRRRNQTVWRHLGNTLDL